jgi:hypothetical protein
MGLAGGRTVVGLPSAGRGARGRLGGRYSRPPGLSGGQKAFRPLEAASASYPPFPKKPSPPGSPRLLWGTRRRFDPSSSPSATLLEVACSPGRLVGNLAQ